MRIADLLLCGILLFVGACSDQDIAAPTALVKDTPPSVAIEPKIVVQFAHQAPVLSVHWLDGGRHMASLASDASIVIWNVAKGTILDHAQLPLDSKWLSNRDSSSPLRFHAWSDLAEQHALVLTYAAVSDEDAAQACPGAHHVATPWCTYSIDLRTREVRADASLPIPVGEPEYWPLSPDQTLRPEPNHGNAIRGLPNTRDEYYFPADATCSSMQRCRFGVTLFDHHAALEPKTVAQLLGHQAPVLAVHWISNGQDVSSLASDGTIVYWDVEQRLLSSQLKLPIDPRLLQSERDQPPALRVHSFTQGPNGRLMVVFAAADEVAAKRACPDAHQAGTPWCGYAAGGWPSEAKADPSLPIPTAETPRWPISPDAKFRVVSHAANDSNDLPNTRGELFGEICTAAQPCRYGIEVIVSGENKISRALTGDPRSYFMDADVSPDGMRLLQVANQFNVEDGDSSHVEMLDLTNGNREPAFVSPLAYHHVRWLDATRYLLESDGYSASNDTEEALAGFPPALLIDPVCAARGDCPSFDSRWQMRPAPDGALIALGSYKNHCFQASLGAVACIQDESSSDSGNLSSDPPATGLALRTASANDWRSLAAEALADQVITAIETSPDRQQLAVATRVWERADAPRAKQVLRVWLFDMADGKPSAPRKLMELLDPLEGASHFTDESTIRALSFSADGRHLVFTHRQAARTSDAGAELYLIDLDDTKNTRSIKTFSRRAVALGKDRVLGLDDGVLLDLFSGRTIAQLPFRAAILRAGWIERSQMLWASTIDGVILFWDSKDGTPQLTLHALPGNRYFAVAPSGRYDTNLSADSAMVRWLMPDAPWQNLAAQTFMRDYYEPGLYRRLLDCRSNDSCETAFKPLPSIASLNRVLPEVRITEVRSGKVANEAVVALELREGVDEDAPNGKTRSGLFNPKLFRNGRLVEMLPRQANGGDADLTNWRKHNQVQANNGVQRVEFTVPLPTGKDAAAQVFSAYAFNEDRIKGETTTLAWTRPNTAPRPRHAYVLAIGIDEYDTPRFRLNYAVADARLMASRLAAIPGFETHHLVLAAERKIDGKGPRVDRITLERVLSLLAGGHDREATLAALSLDGIDASVLQKATPDDAVIVSFSGHGWANAQGDFYLIPGDGRWPDGAETPDLSSLFATTDLVAPFQSMQAGEIALVIDACHSAASVADGRFKPGPMGDSGLGQLAYDKGIRILAATQADDVALEDARLGQGLLTYALAVDGLGAGDADLNQDGKIRVDEWLSFAVRRLPTLATDARVGRISNASTGARAITFHDLPADAPARRVQQPSLFDFNSQPSTVVLQQGAR